MVHVVVIRGGGMTVAEATKLCYVKSCISRIVCVVRYNLYLTYDYFIVSMDGSGLDSAFGCDHHHRRVTT